MGKLEIRDQLMFGLDWVLWTQRTVHGSTRYILGKSECNDGFSSDRHKEK